MLHQLDIVGGSLAGKTSAAMAYAVQACTWGPVLYVHPFGFSAWRDEMHARIPEGVRHHLTYVKPDRLFHIQGGQLFNTIICDGWEYLDPFEQQQLEHITAMCDATRRNTWLVRVQSTDAYEASRPRLRLSA